MRNFRILRLANAAHYSGVEKEYLNQINPNWVLQSYQEQKAIWDSRYYVYADSFSYWMRKLGNEAMDIVVDCVSLQSSWARENDINTLLDDWKIDTVLAQIGKFKPDVVYLQDVHVLPSSIRKSLKSIFPFIKLVVIFRGYPGGSLRYFADFCDADMLLVSAPQLVTKFEQLGKEAHLVYHSFDHRINRFLNTVLDKDKVQLSFVGSLGYGTSEHAERANLINILSAQSELTIYSDDPWQNSSINSKVQNAFGRLISFAVQDYRVRKLGRNILAYKHLFPISIKSKLKKIIMAGRLTHKNLQIGTKIFPGVHGLNMYQALANSKISFNAHSNAAKGAVENMRMFQATGVGSCLLTDWGRNISELFEPDREVICYKTPEELIDKLRQLESNDNLRAEIAKNGQLRVLRDHTTEKRVAQIHTLISTKL